MRSHFAPRRHFRAGPRRCLCTIYIIIQGIRAAAAARAAVTGMKSDNHLVPSCSSAPPVACKSDILFPREGSGIWCPLATPPARPSLSSPGSPATQRTASRETDCRRWGCRLLGPVTSAGRRRKRRRPLHSASCQLTYGSADAAWLGAAPIVTQHASEVQLLSRSSFGAVTNPSPPSDQSPSFPSLPQHLTLL